jgi:hypothetical protein
VTTRNVRRRFPKSVFAVLLSIALLVLLAGSQPGVLAAQKSKDYALIFGTVWGPDNRPVYGVKVKIRRARDKKPKWEVFSDHNGEFAQRVPVGDSDYILTADLKGIKTTDGKPLHADNVTVHIYDDERQDTGIHLKP